MNIRNELLDIIDINISLDKYMDDSFLYYIYDEKLYRNVLEKIDLLNSYIKMRLSQLRYFVLINDIDYDKYREIVLIIDLLMDLPNKYLDMFIKNNNFDNKYYVNFHNDIDSYIKKLGINI